MIRDFAAAKGTLEAVQRLADLQDGDAFREAVIALVKEAKAPHAPGDVDRAVALLRQGQAGPAEAIFERILAQKQAEGARKQAEGAAAYREAAEAARHLGALAYLHDTRKAIEAFATATRLDPDHTWSWIYLGRLCQRIGTLADAERAYERARQVAEGAPAGWWPDGGEVTFRTAGGSLAGPHANFTSPKYLTRPRGTRGSLPGCGGRPQESLS